MSVLGRRALIALGLSLPVQALAQAYPARPLKLVVPYAPGGGADGVARIIAKRVLQAIPAIWLNTHAGITPRYRGCHGAWWAISEGRREFAGVTVHRVDAGIDTGGIVGQALIAPDPRDSFSTLPLRQLAAGLPILAAAVRAALDGTLTSVPSVDPAPSRLWHHPTVGEYLRTVVTRRVW